MLNLRTLYAFAACMLLLAGCAKKSSTPESQTPSSGDMTASNTTQPTDTTGMNSTSGTTGSMDNTMNDTTASGGMNSGGMNNGGMNGGGIAGSSAGDVGSSVPEAGSKPAPLTDDQIAMITDKVNAGEVEQAKLAKEKAKDKRVRQYAQHMIQQHTKAKNKGDQLAKKEKLAPSESPVSTDLTSSASQALESLKTAEATSFDKTYIDSQIQQHQRVLDLLNSQLIPNATNMDLKAQLEEARSMVETHLAEAKELQMSLASGGNTTSSLELKPKAKGQTTAALGSQPQD